MSEEETKPTGEGTPAPTSEETPKDQTPAGETPKDDGSNNQLNTEELEKLKKENEEVKAQFEKKEAEFNKLGFQYRKLKEVADQAGVEIPEDNPGLNIEQVQELLKKDREEQQKFFQTQLSEVMKAVGRKPDAVPVGGGGQKTNAPLHPVPDSKEVRELLAKGWKWDTETGLITSPSGRVVDLNDQSDISR